jgi:hypothetical protein
MDYDIINLTGSLVMFFGKENKEEFGLFKNAY